MGEKKEYSRREMLKMSAAAGTGIAIGASGFGSLVQMMDHMAASKETTADAVVPFYGNHQAGIITPQQTYVYLAGFDIVSDKRSDVIALLKQWTRSAEQWSKGIFHPAQANEWLPPKDSGEAIDLGPAKLTVTVGFGPTFFKRGGRDRFGVASRAPRHLRDIPRMPHDDLDAGLSGGDLCVQVCANDQQVVFHAIRNLIRSATGTAVVKWTKEGFMSAPDGKTPRNLFGFKDGTANVSGSDAEALKRIVWAGHGEPAWMKGGTYMAYRKIQMFLEVWDRSSLKDQEDTFGRKKLSGAPYGKANEQAEVDVSKLPPNSHVRLAKSTDKQIYRRGYSYTDGIDERTGNVNAGLLFLSFQRNPDESFIPMLRLLSKKDALNEYTKHVASGMFACPGGVRKGEYIGQRLLEPM
ncbi:MAG TPA: iron uptake transporter deferrochelatase/peroxidase subunit [Bacillales bacterium]|nr:iron uptake transporter deferrochelatase/peroxidase subunit [Bacillales bacterium]